MKMSSGYPVQRKADGRTIQWRRDRSQPRIQMFPSSYIQREKVAAARFMSTVEKLEEEKHGIQRFSFTEG